MSWIAHIIRQGEHLEALALRHGFDAQQVWEDSRNADLREQRSNPAMLAPGDILHMPDNEPTTCPCTAASTNRYRGRIPTVEVALVMSDDSGQPLANEPYQVYGLPALLEGTTDGDGNLSFRVPLGVEEVMLDLVALQRRHPIRVGHLDPPETSHGVTQRLRHLGHFGAWVAQDEVPPAQDSQLREAIASFQRSAELEPTGVMDDETREQLVEAHGS